MEFVQIPGHSDTSISECSVSSSSAEKSALSQGLSALSQGMRYAEEVGYVCLSVLLQEKELSPDAASRRVLWPLGNWKWEPPPVQPLLCEAAAAALTL